MDSDRVSVAGLCVERAPAGGGGRGGEGGGKRSRWHPWALLGDGLILQAENRDSAPHGASLFQEEGDGCFCDHSNYPLQTSSQLPKGINTVGLPIRHEAVGEVSDHSLQ